MNMVDCSNMRIMAHEQIDTKSNEIKAGPKLVSQFNLNGAIVSADALNTVVELAEAILKCNVQENPWVKSRLSADKSKAPWHSSDINI